MRDAWQIGRLFGIPLRIHVSWLLVFGLVSWSLAAGYFPAQLPDLPVWSYWTKAIITAAMFFASLILHELGHSLVARWHGVGIASITLFVLGGVSEMRDEPRTPRQEFEIAAIGPAISLALAGVFALGQFIEGNFLTPRIVGARIRLHPVWVIFAVLAGTALYGLPGTFLGTPAAAIVAVLVRLGIQRWRGSRYYQAADRDISAA